MCHWIIYHNIYGKRKRFKNDMNVTLRLLIVRQISHWIASWISLYVIQSKTFFFFLFLNYSTIFSSTFYTMDTRLFNPSKRRFTKFLLFVGSQTSNTSLGLFLYLERQILVSDFLLMALHSQQTYRSTLVVASFPT